MHTCHLVNAATRFFDQAIGVMLRHRDRRAGRVLDDDLRRRDGLALTSRAGFDHQRRQRDACRRATVEEGQRCITEGRKRFLRLYEELETGVECERLAPVLASLAAGEASAEELLDIRPHLRNCAGCRATVRALHASRLRRVTALLPLGAVVEPVRGLFERLRGPRGSADVGELHPMQRAEQLDEAFRQLHAVDPAVVEGASRASTARLNLRGWVEAGSAATPELRCRFGRARGGEQRRRPSRLDRRTDRGLRLGRGRGDLLRRHGAVARPEAGDPGGGEASETRQEASRTKQERDSASHLECATRPRSEHGDPQRPRSGSEAQDSRSPSRQQPAQTDEFSFESSATGSGSATARTTSQNGGTSSSNGSFESGASSSGATGGEFSDGTGGEFSP